MFRCADADTLQQMNVSLSRCWMARGLRFSIGFIQKKISTEAQVREFANFLRSRPSRWPSAPRRCPPPLHQTIPPRTSTPSLDGGEGRAEAISHQIGHQIVPIRNHDGTSRRRTISSAGPRSPQSPFPFSPPRQQSSLVWSRNATFPPAPDLKLLPVELDGLISPAPPAGREHPGEYLQGRGLNNKKNKKNFHPDEDSADVTQGGAPQSPAPPSRSARMCGDLYGGV